MRVLPCNGQLDGGFEFFELDRFDQMLGKACLQASFDVAVVTKTADGDSWDFGDRAQLHHHLQAASVRQSNIAYQQVELIATCGFHGRANIVGRCDEMSATDEQLFQSSTRVLM